MEASIVVFSHSEEFMDRRYAVHNFVDRKTTVAELGFDLLRALSNKLNSVEADRSVICKCLRTVKVNDK